MTNFKHINFSESIVMRELEKIARKTGMIEEDIFIPIINKKASVKLAENKDDLFSSIVSLASVMRERGFKKQAADLEEKAVLYIKAYNTPTMPIEERQEREKNLYNTRMGEGVLTSAHAPLDEGTLPSQSNEGHIETIEEINKILMDSTKKVPTGKVGDNLSHKLVIMAKEALNKIGQEFDPDAATANLGKSLEAANNAKEQITETLETAIASFKKLVIVDETTNSFTQEIISFANNNKIGAKEIAKYSKAKQTEKALGDQFRQIMSNMAKSNFEQVPEINSNITDMIDLTNLSNSLRLFNQKAQAYKADEKNDQLKNEAVQAAKTVQDNAAKLFQEYNTNMISLRDRIVAGIKQIADSDAINIEKISKEIGATNLDVNGVLDLGKATHIISIIPQAMAILGKWAGPLKDLTTNITTLNGAEKALQAAVNEDKRFAGGDPVSPDMAQFRTTLDKLRNLWQIISQEMPDTSDPGAQAIKGYLGKFSKLYNILLKNPNIKFNRLKALYPNIGYADAKALLQEIGALTKNTDEADGVWKKKLNVSEGSQANTIVKMAGNPLLPGGSTTPTTPRDGGGGYTQRMDYMKDSEASGMVKQMQAALSNFADFFRSKATEGTDDEPVNQELFTYANAMNTQKGEMGKELDKMWGPHTAKALGLVNNLLNNKKKYQKEFPLLSSTEVHRLEDTAPDPKESPMSVSKKARNNIIKIYNVLSLAGDPSQAGRLSSLVAGNVLDRLPKVPASETHYAETAGDNIPLQAGHLRDLLTLKMYLEEKGFTPEGAAPAQKAANYFINEINKLAQIGLPAEGPSSEMPVIEKGWTFQHWDNILKYIRNRAAWQYEEISKSSAEDPASKQKRQILTSTKLMYVRLVEKLLRDLRRYFDTYKAAVEKKDPSKQILNSSILPDALLSNVGNKMYGADGGYGGGAGGYPGAFGGGTSKDITSIKNHPFLNPQDKRLIPIKDLLTAYSQDLRGNYSIIEQGPQYLTKMNWRDGDVSNALNELKTSDIKNYGAYVRAAVQLLKEVNQIYMESNESKGAKQEQYREYMQFMPGMSRLPDLIPENKNVAQPNSATEQKPSPINVLKGMGLNT